jgi:hypothetical protein
MSAGKPGALSFVDWRNLRRFAAIARVNTRMARNFAARSYVQDLAAQVSARAPRDTNRYVRGWLDAMNQTGAVLARLPVIEPSQYADRYQGTLEKALRAALSSRDRLERRISVLYPSGSPKRGSTPAFRELTKLLRRAERRLDKLIEYKQAFDASGGTAIVIGGFGGNEQKGTLKPKVSARVYGGQGRIIDGAEQTAVVLTNREPHANLVERKYKVMRLSQSFVAASGGLFLKRERANFVKALLSARKASGA